MCVCVFVEKSACMHYSIIKSRSKSFKHIHRTCQLSYAICIHMTPNSNSYCFSIVPAVLLLLQAMISHRNPRLPTPTESSARTPAASRSRHGIIVPWHQGRRQGVPRSGEFFSGENGGARFGIDQMIDRISANPCLALA